MFCFQRGGFAGNKRNMPFFIVAFAFGLVICPGCASPFFSSAEDEFWRPDEQIRIRADREDFELIIRDGEDSRVLRTRARPVPDGMDLAEVAARMEKTMQDAGGVGIAAPQVGLSLRMAVLNVDYKTEYPRNLVVLNPCILERSDESRPGYEGCLSIPDKGGLVRRSEWIRVQYTTLDGEYCEEFYDGPNAVLWQHELDHLDGVLYVDRLIGDLLPWEEAKRLREEMENSD
jgi:peptide deformylase